MTEENNQEENLIYKPNDSDKAETDFVYAELDDMITERNKTWRQFNDRTLVDFIDDSEKRAQGYVPDRESQGKEDWESNVFNQSTRAKVKALVAAVAVNPPRTPIMARNIWDGSLDVRRGEYMEALVNHARAWDNAETQIFWEAWQACVQGTVIKYNGYLKTIQDRKFIKSYNFETGEMTFDTRKVLVDDKCVDVDIPLTELFIKSFKIFDIQDQPAIAWVRYVDRDTAEMELGKYKNWKYCLAKNSKRYQSDTESFFSKNFEDRVDEDEFEIVKYYNKSRDTYDIICNGVLLLRAPLIWGLTKKYYPFSKSIFEPFSNKHFFYGNSLPYSNMGSQDSINALYNMGLDKTYRSLNPEKLVGTKNKDLLELENEDSGVENTIYVDDVAQVKWLEAPGLNAAEMAMIKWVGQQMDLGSVDVNQQGVATRGVTAREIVIANENAKKIKGIFFTFLTDLWIQKTKLTIVNVMMHYPMAKQQEIIGEEGVKVLQETWPTYYVKNTTLPGGRFGNIGIQIVKNKKSLPKQKDLDIQEEVMKLKGMNYSLAAITKTYFDDYDYEPEVVSDNLYQQDLAEAQAVFTEKLKTMMIAFPEIYAQNKKVLFEDFMKAYKDKLDRYNVEPPQALLSPIPSPGQPAGATTARATITPMNPLAPTAGSGKVEGGQG